MALVIDNETVTAFGDYVLNEDTSGNVSSVDLFFNLGTSEIKIATLTDIVVVEEGNNLSATFNIELSIPEESDFDVCNSIQRKPLYPAICFIFSKLNLECLN